MPGGCLRVATSESYSMFLLEPLHPGAVMKDGPKGIKDIVRWSSQWSMCTSEELHFL